MQEEVENRTVNLAISMTKLTGRTTLLSNRITGNSIFTASAESETKGGMAIECQIRQNWCRP